MFENIDAQSVRKATVKQMINKLPDHELPFIG